MTYDTQIIGPVALAIASLDPITRAIGLRIRNELARKLEISADEIAAAARAIAGEAIKPSAQQVETRWTRLRAMMSKDGFDYFSFSVEIHNAANRALGKPEMQVAAARAHYASMPEPPALPEGKAGSMEDWRARFGPALWQRWHWGALRSTATPAERLREIIALWQSIPCGECKTNFAAHLDAVLAAHGA
jgi:hypothetical protein